MILSRLVSLFLRFGEFVCATVVLGLVGHFLHEYHVNHTGPKGREIYTTVIAALSIILSLVWMIPFTFTMLHYPIDFIFSAAWFAAFGALVNWLHKTNCGSAFHWGGITHGGYCDQWRAAEAFSFIAACFWLASAILGIYVFHKLRRQHPVATDGTTTRRRWGRSHV